MSAQSLATRLGMTPAHSITCTDDFQVAAARLWSSSNKRFEALTSLGGSTSGTFPVGLAQMRLDSTRLHCTGDGCSTWWTYDYAARVLSLLQDSPAHSHLFVNDGGGVQLLEALQNQRMHFRCFTCRTIEHLKVAKLEWAQHARRCMHDRGWFTWPTDWTSLVLEMTVCASFRSQLHR